MRLERPMRAGLVRSAAVIAVLAAGILSPLPLLAASCPPPGDSQEISQEGQEALRSKAVGPSTALAGDPVIQSLVDSVSQASYVTALRELSGAQGATVLGRPDTILTRAAGTLGNIRAAEYIEERFRSYGMTVTLQNFNEGRILFNLDAVSDLVDGSRAWVVGAGGRVFATVDAGALWRWQETPVTNRLRAVDFRNGEVGLACGNTGAIVRTTNGGETWSAVASGTASNLRGVEVVDATHAWIADEGGKILVSTDDGASWSDQSSGTGAALYATAFVSTSTGWAVGAAGTILATTNGGAAWSPQASGVALDLNAVRALDAATVVAAGASGTIVRTTNAGATWGSVASGTTQALNALAFAGATGWACGNAGALLKTTNAGATWSVETSGTTDGLRGASAWSATDAWVCGNAAVFRRTTDGTTWQNRVNALLAGWVNVIGEWTGTSAPSEVLVAGGHFDSTSPVADSLAPGADDNGTGTVALLEAARVLSRFASQGCLGRTVRLVAFGGEEVGLVGSGVYAQSLADQGANVVGMINYDAIAYNYASPFRIIWNWDSQWLADSLVAVRDRYVPALSLASFVCDPPSACGWSDHYPFWARGFDAVVGIEWWDPAPPYHHTVADTAGTIANFSLAVSATRLLVGSVGVLGKFRCTTDVARPIGVPGPAALVLGPSLPNVFRTATRIPFWLPASGRARLAIYDSSGRVVCSVLDRDMPAGWGEARWDGRDGANRAVASGVYFASLRSGGEVRVERLVLVK